MNFNKACKKIGYTVIGYILHRYWLHSSFSTAFNEILKFLSPTISLADLVVSKLLPMNATKALFF